MAVAAQQQSPPRWRLQTAPLLISLALLVGVTIFLYPSAASWVSQYQQAQQVTGYTQSVSELTEQERAAALEAARDYNARLGRPPIVDPFSNNPDAYVTESGYDNVLQTPGGVMARLHIPTIDVDLPIYHGTSEETLMKGIGHLEGTSLPVGGPGTHAVLTGHRGLPEAMILTELDKVEFGDTFTIETFGEVMTYEVTGTEVVLPHETEKLYPQAGREQVTLITCTPLGVNSHRILVTGDRIPTPEQMIDSAQDPGPPFPWWAVVAAITLAAAVAYVWQQGRAGRPAHTTTDTEAARDASETIGETTP